MCDDALCASAEGKISRVAATTQNPNIELLELDVGDIRLQKSSRLHNATCPLYAGRGSLTSGKVVPACFVLFCTGCMQASLGGA